MHPYLFLCWLLERPAASTAWLVGHEQLAGWARAFFGAGAILATLALLRVIAVEQPTPPSELS